MRTVLLASLRVHTRRYVAAAVAVVIGVAFVVTTDALASSARNGMVAGVELPYAHADVVVSDLDGDRADDLLADAADRGDRAAVLGWTVERVRVDDRLLHDQSDVGALADSAELRWQTLEDGRFPTGPGEAVADVNAAKGDRVELGDTLQVGTGSRAVEATVVGLVDTPSATVGADFYLPWSDVRAFSADFYVDSVAYAGPGSETLADRLGDATVQPRDEFVEERQTELTNEVNVLSILLLVFASIALFVSVLVMTNTFSILFAQRTRDFALLRCVGATRRQVLRSVRVEAVALGVAASLLGLLAGTVVGAGLVALARSRFPSGTMGAVTPSPRWYAAAFVIGLVVTVVAAWLPTRRVVRVGPLAALRPDDATDVRTAAGRVRMVLGALVTAAGVALLALAIDQHSVAVMVAGGGAAFTGVLLLGPVLVPAAIRLAGAAAGRLGGGVPVRLATRNAVRNPRRTAATAASLLVGVTLTTAVLTGLASSRSAVADDLDKDYPVDLALTSAGEALPDDLLDDVRRTAGVASAVQLDGATGSLSDGIGQLQVVAATGVDPVVHGTPGMADARPREVWVPWDLIGGAGDGDRVTVTVAGRTETLRLRGGEGWGDAALVAPATLALLTDAVTPRAVWVRAEADADAEDLAGDLDALAQPAGADLSDSLANRSWVELQLDILTGTVVALLGIAVLIALIGIGNTLGLSVLERGREIALLRALGLTRRQLRATLASEAVLLSVVATVIGAAIGVAFAWVAVETLVRAAVDQAPLVLPWGQLTVVVLVAGVAGLVSCLLPARRAARMTPAAGLSLD